LISHFYSSVRLSCPSVRPLLVLCLNGYAYRRSFSPSDRALILVFLPSNSKTPLQNSKANTLTGGSKYRDIKICVFRPISPIIAETAKRYFHSNYESLIGIHRYSIDLSHFRRPWMNLKGWTRKAPFRRISAHYRLTNSTLTIVQAVCFRGRQRPETNGVGSQRSEIFFLELGSR